MGVTLSGIGNQGSTDSDNSPSQWKALLDSARAEVAAETRLARAGLSTLSRYSNHVDQLLKDIYDHAKKEINIPTALIAIGGYGRQQLCLHSDIDLMVVFDGQIKTAEQRFLRSLLHPLWDLHLDVGHQVRQLSELNVVETDNPKHLLALLEARFLAGEQSVFESFSKTCLSENSAWRQPTQRALIDLTNKRHAHYNRTVFQLEPDIKDAPGALRDATAMRLFERLEPNPGGYRLISNDIGRLREAEDFLLRIRSILHLERGRNYNDLSHELQETVAALFGSPGEKASQQVESLMSTYFHHARLIERSLAVSMKSITAPSTWTTMPLGNDLERSWDGIRFGDSTRSSLRPRTWLRAFETALDVSVSVSDQVLTCIERHSDRYAPERFFPSPVERDTLLRVLRPRPGLYERLSEMHGSGLLGRMFPEFQRVYCLVIRDFYHKYTVDEHTLLTIRNVEQLLMAQTNSRQRFTNVLNEIEEPQLLILSLLFHDVGKWTNKNHSEEGARMACGALRRIGLPEHSTATVEFLIRHHLRMSAAAFRRDIEDPDTVTQFARLVGTENRLKLLLLFTFADVAGVGPDVMTPWKEERLWQLYVAAYNCLTLSYSDDVIDDENLIRDDLDRQRPSDISREELTAFLEGYPQRYLRVVDRSRVYEHVRLSRDLQPSEVHTTLTENDAAWELSAITIDAPGLFASICGVLSYFGMNILRGQAMTNEHGVVLDIFQFSDQEGYLRMNESAKSEMIDSLENVISGKQDIEKKLQGRQHAQITFPKPERVKPVIRFNDHYSQRFTVLEIVTNNAWGLLYRISQTISSEKCDIELVLISTEGAKAIDVFHLTKAGGKLANPVQQTLAEALEATFKHTS